VVQTSRAGCRTPSTAATPSGWLSEVNALTPVWVLGSMCPGPRRCFPSYDSCRWLFDVSGRAGRELEFARAGLTFGGRRPNHFCRIPAHPFIPAIGSRDDLHARRLDVSPLLSSAVPPPSAWRTSPCVMNWPSCSDPSVALDFVDATAPSGSGSCSCGRAGGPAFSSSGLRQSSRGTARTRPGAGARSKPNSASSVMRSRSSPLPSTCGALAAAILDVAHLS